MVFAIIQPTTSGSSRWYRKKTLSGNMFTWFLRPDKADWIMEFESSLESRNETLLLGVTKNKNQQHPSIDMHGVITYFVETSIFNTGSAGWYCTWDVVRLLFTNWTRSKIVVACMGCYEPLEGGCCQFSGSGSHYFGSSSDWYLHDMTWRLLGISLESKLVGIISTLKIRSCNFFGVVL